ncbi:MAG: hypothetical protein Hens2KO_02700 [Henriciella sp.]
MLKSLIALAFAAIAIDAARAQLNINPAVMSFQGAEDTRQDIKVKNTSARTQYLTVSAARIAEPGIYPETYLESPDPKQVGLLVAPRRIVLQPNEERVIRVILLEDAPERDKAWRVRIAPTIGEIQSEKSVAVPLLSFKALVIAQPDHPTVDIVGERTGRILTLVNRGNSNATLSDGQQCSEDKTACQRIGGKRLWPGLEWTTELPTEAPVTFKLKGAGEARTIGF